MNTYPYTFTITVGGDGKKHPCPKCGSPSHAHQERRWFAKDLIGRQCWTCGHKFDLAEYESQRKTVYA